MEIKNVLECQTREGLGNWLRQTTETVFWVSVSMKPTTDTLLYLDVVEEALCVGWIDSTKKKVGD